MIVMIAPIVITTIVVMKIKSDAGDLVPGGCLVELGGEGGEKEGGEKEGGEKEGGEKERGEEDGETSVNFECGGGIFPKSAAIDNYFK